MLRLVFMAWSGCKDGKATFDVECGQAGLRELDCLVARALHSFRVSGRRVTALVRKDDNNYYQEMAHKAGECDRQSGLQQLWKCIKGGLPKHKARRRNDNPMTCVSLDAQWHPYFKNLELGKEMRQHSPSRQLSTSTKRTRRIEIHNSSTGRFAYFV